MKSIHVAKIFVKPGTETLWSSLPELDLDMANISESWEAKQAVIPLAADVEDETDKEVDRMALTLEEGRDVGILIRGIKPRLVSRSRPS